MHKIFVKALLINCSLSFIAHAEEDPWQRSHMLEAQANYAGAAQALQEVLKTDRQHEFALTRYAWLSYLQKEYNLAIDNYRLALENNPKSLDAKLGIMLPLMAQGRWKEATIYGEDILKTAPYQYYAHIRLMACEEALQQWNKLYIHARDINQFYPTDPTILVYLARAASITGKTNTAIDAYNSVLERIPGHLEAIRFLAANKTKP